MALPEAISIKLASELLDVNPVTIRRWIRYRYILAYRVGPSLIRIPRSEIARLRSLRVNAADNCERPKYPEV